MKLVLPFPPSVNNLYFNPRGGDGRRVTARYRKWRERATQAMWGQRIEFFHTPVCISIVFEDAGKADIDNLSKSCLDHLVRHQIIPDDGRQWVRRLSLEWGDVKGVEMEITPWA